MHRVLLVNMLTVLSHQWAIVSRDMTKLNMKQLSYIIFIYLVFIFIYYENRTQAYTQDS